MEVYLRSEGVLVRYWYPIEMLEKPPQGFRKSSITGGQTLDTSNVLIHRLAGTVFRTREKVVTLIVFKFMINGRNSDWLLYKLDDVYLPLVLFC